MGAYYSSSRNWVKWTIGRMLGCLMPAKRAAMVKGIGSDNKRPGLVERAIRFELFFNAVRNENHEDLKNFHQQYWSGPQSQDYYENATHRFNSYFEEHFKKSIDLLESYMISNPDEVDFICEIGSGDGSVMRYLADRFKHICHFTGLDLNPEVVESNIRKNKDGRVDFVCARGQDWITSCGRPNGVYLTHGGVFEYFTQNDLVGLINFISRNLSPAIMIISEPVADDYDLAQEKTSRIFGSEASFSHNYPRLLKDAGFEILQSEEVFIEHYRMIMILAAI